MKAPVVSTLLALPLAINVALAQDSPALEEIIITATKRAENIQDVPLSVSTLSGEKLDVISSGSPDIRFLRGRVPSLNIESSFGRAFPRFYIRGYGNTDFDLNASQPVSLVYDEVVQENPILKGFPIFDVERIETLRGPQGTLFGRNTPAGIVKIDSVRPSEEFGGYGKLSAGRYGSIDFEGVLNGAISPNWSARLSTKFMHRDDWIDNWTQGQEDSLGGFDEFAIRAQALYDAGGDFAALFNLHYRDLDGTARTFRANIIEPGSNNIVSNFRRDDVFYDGENEQDLDSIGFTAKLEWALGNNTTLTSVTGYESAEIFSRGDIDGGFGAAFLGNNQPGFIPFDAQSADGLPDHDQISQELRWSSNEWGALDWQAGLFYFTEDLTIDSFNYDSLFGGGQNGFATQTQETDAWGIFGSIDYQMSDRTTFKAGLRLSDDSKDFRARRDQSPLAFLGVGPLPTQTVDVSDDEWSGDLSVNHDWTDNVSVYARAARGFRAPSIQGRVLFGDVVSVADSETIVSIEGGIKSTLLDGRARLNASIYSYTVDDLQLTAVGGQTNFNTLINAAEANGQGFEIDGELLITEGLVLTFGTGYNDTEIDDPNLGIQPCGGGCTVLDPEIAPGIVSIDGNSLPQSPEWTANGTLEWTQEVVYGGQLQIIADWFYRDEVNFFLYESEEFRGDSLSELGLRATYSWDDGAQRFSLFGRNVTDEEELVGGIDFNNLTGFVNEPRFWGAEYAIEF